MSRRARSERSAGAHRRSRVTQLSVPRRHPIAGGPNDIAISVLSAVEGLTVAAPQLESMILPISIVILIGLFMVQARGTARVGAIFGPLVLIYMAVLAILGVSNIVERPDVIGALNPLWAIRFFVANPTTAFLAMGSVFLAVTGAETLYADMGHFGRRAIAYSWLAIAYPCLMLN